MQENERTIEECFQAQAIGVKELGNARQLGGYEGADGRRIKEDLLIRTAQLSDASEEDIRVLKDRYHVSHVVDFRTGVECDFAPDPAIENAGYTWIDLMEQSKLVGKMMQNQKTSVQPEELLEELLKLAGTGSAYGYYMQLAMSEYSVEGYRRFFRILLDSEEGAILWHCTQGKDRTGLAAALILAALGTDEETILKDYELSNVYFAEQTSTLERMALERGCTQEEIEGVRALSGVDRNNMEKILDFMKEQFGSVEAYLHEKILLSDSDISALRGKYLV